MIPYGADRIGNADSGVLAQYGLQPGGYAMVVARPEPENSTLEIIAAFSRKPRGMKLVVLGRYDPEVPYYNQVQDVASGEVMFPGAIYDKAAVSALRFHSSLYAHGHQVGGTNPSLVEAMGAVSAVLAHAPPLPSPLPQGARVGWVAGTGARYFEGEQQCCRPVGRYPLRPSRDRAHARGEPRAAWGDVYVGGGVGGV
jgi:hypothetical protein